MDTMTDTTTTPLYCQLRWRPTLRLTAGTAMVTGTLLMVVMCTAMTDTDTRMAGYLAAVTAKTTVRPTAAFKC